MSVNGRDRVLNPGPLSRRPDKSTTTPRSDHKFLTNFLITFRNTYSRSPLIFYKDVSALFTLGEF
jgi:hypothetical protein